MGRVLGQLRHWIEDLSEEGGGDFIVWEQWIASDGEVLQEEVGRHLNRRSAELQLADLRLIEIGDNTTKEA